MNFDANTLSALMQMLSAQKQPRKDSNAENNTRNGNQHNYSANAYNDGYAQNYRQPYDNNAYNRNGMNQSVFAMQNGLGETVDISGQNRTEKTSQKSQPTNPMSSLLEMMTGKSQDGTGGDAMSSLLPMLFNMMNGKTKQNPVDASQSQTSPKNSTPTGETKANQSTNSDLDKYKAMFEEAMRQERENSDQQNRPENRTENAKEEIREETKYEKTQPIYKDKFEPIAFAGYTLISALNKLYIAKRATR